MLIGFAHTTITVPTLIANRSKFHLLVFSPQDVQHPDFQSFLSLQDGRLKVLLLTEVRALSKVAHLKDQIHSFMVFDSPENLEKAGALILDGYRAEEGWKSRKFSVDELDKALEQATTQNLETSVAKEKEPMSDELMKLEGAEDGTLRALLYRILLGVVPQGFVEQLVKYQCGLSAKRVWTYQAKKPALSAGADPVAMQDLETYVDGRYGIRIHRTVYKYFTAEVPLDEAITTYKSDEGDVKFCLSVLGDRQLKDDDFYYKPSFNA